jgi:hypothetical protein
MYVKLTGFAPDAEPNTDGIFTDCDLLVPTLRGFKALPQDVDAGVTVGASAVASAYAYKLTDNTNRTVAGTEGNTAGAATSMLYDVGVSSWTDRTRAEGAYTATAAARWTFATYGNVSDTDVLYAAQKGAVLQKSTGGQFSNVSGAPQALCIVSVLDFVMAFNTNEATYGSDPNRWWCSAAGDGDDWTPNVATQCTTGLLADSSGAITAAATIGSNVVAFKEREAYLGQYVGAPAVWGWQRIPGEGMGAYSHYSVVSVEGVGLLFPGRDNFYIFDGSRATPIGTNRVAEFFLEDLNIAEARRMIGYHNRNEWTVFWWYTSIASTAALDRYLAYNYRANTWTYGRKTVKFAFEYLEPGITFDEVGDYYATWDDLPDAPYDTAFGSGGTFRPAVIDATNTIYKLEGTGNPTYYTTGNVGIDGGVTVVTRIRPRFKVVPTTGNQEHRYADILGSTEEVSRSNSGMTDGSFDHVWAARWHKVKHSYTGDMEIMGLDLEAKPDSME